MLSFDSDGRNFGEPHRHHEHRSDGPMERRVGGRDCNVGRVRCRRSLRRTNIRAMLRHRSRRCKSTRSCDRSRTTYARRRRFSRPHRLRFAVAEGGVTASRQSVDETAILYKQGLAKAIELVDANDSRFEAETSYAAAQFAVAEAYLALRRWGSSPSERSCDEVVLNRHGWSRWCSFFRRAHAAANRRRAQHQLAERADTRADRPWNSRSKSLPSIFGKSATSSPRPEPSPRSSRCKSPHALRAPSTKSRSPKARTSRRDKCSRPSRANRYQVAVDQAKAAVEKASATQAQAEAQLARRAGANAAHPGLVTGEDIATFQTNVQTAKADVAAAQQQVKVAQLNLRDSFVKAPITGTIQTRTVETGQYLQAGTVLATLLQRDPLLLKFQVTEQDAPRLKPGMPVNLSMRESANTYTAAINRGGLCRSDVATSWRSPRSSTTRITNIGCVPARFATCRFRSAERDPPQSSPKARFVRAKKAFWRTSSKARPRKSASSPKACTRPVVSSKSRTGSRLVTFSCSSAKSRSATARR